MALLPLPSLRTVRRCLALPLLLTATLACTAGPARPSAFLAPAVSVPLPSVVPLGRALSAEQRLTVEFRGERHQFQAALEVADGTLTLVGLAPWGGRMLTVRYDGHTLTEERLPGTERLPSATQILADVMLVYWPASAWREVLPAGWRLEDSPRGRRLLDARGESLADIERGPAAVLLTNHAFGYRLRIETLSGDRP